MPYGSDGYGAGGYGSGGTSLLLQIWRTGGAGYTDYSAWLYGGEEFLVSKTHALNEPQEATFVLQDGTAGFQVPESGNRVSISTATLPNFFTGYLIAKPERELLGRNPNTGLPVYGYKCRAVSEEVRLEWKARAIFPTLAPFLNKTQGEIVKALISVLGGGLGTTGVAAGLLIPFFRVKAEEGFFEAVRRLSDRSNMKFWTENGQAKYTTIADASFGYTPDETDPLFNPHDLSVRVIDNPVFNDVVGVGGVEPQAYVKEYFAGDGLTATFPLKFAPYGDVSGRLIEEEWTAAAIDANRWVETDTDNVLYLGGGSLRIDGGTGLAPARLTAKQGLEMSGALELRAGRVDFNVPTDAFIGCLFSADTGLQADIIAGFQCLQTATQTVIRAVVNGVAVGPTYTTLYNKTYQFTVVVSANVYHRVSETFFSLNNQYGGVAQAASGVGVSFLVTEFSDSESDTAKRVLEHIDLIGSMPQWAYYTVVVGPTADTAPYTGLLLSLNFTLLRRPPQVDLLTKAVGAAAFKRERLGDRSDVEARAALINGPEGTSVQFFVDQVPAERELIKVVYRAAGIARARVREGSSIATEAARAGDDGVRAAILPALNPLPSTSQELETAIQAFINDAAATLYEGTWTFFSKSTPILSAPEPLSGRKITVSATSRYPTFTALVTSIRISLLAKTTNEELFEVEVNFGTLKNLDEHLKRLQPPEEVLTGSEDSVSPISATEFAAVGTSVAADRPNADYALVKTATTFQIDMDAAPSSSYEVRKTDAAWGSASAINSVSNPATQVFTIPRKTRDTIVFIKNKDATDKLSRYPSVVRLNFPLIPDTPLVNLLSTDHSNPIIWLPDSTLLDPNFFGWRITETSVYGSTELFRVEGLALLPADLRWTKVNNTDAAFTLLVYAFNLLGEDSAVYTLNASGLSGAGKPPVTAPQTTPGAPTSLTNGSGAGEFAFVWSPPAGATNTDQLSYRVTLASNSAFTVDVETFADLSLTAFTLHKPNLTRFWKVDCKYPNSAYGAAATFGAPTAVTSGRVQLDDDTIDGPTRRARTAAHSTYRPLTNPLTATDAGTTATVNIAAFTMRTADAAISISSGSITNLSFDTLYFIYYDDASFAGGAVTFAATTTKETGMSGAGRFFVGSIITPKDGGADMIGNNDGGAGAQSGRLYTLRPGTATQATVSIGSVTDRENARDGDDTSFATLTAPGSGAAAQATVELLDFPGSVEALKSLTLKVRSEVPTFDTDGPGHLAALSYSTNDGVSFTDIFSVTTTRALSLDSVTLAVGLNPSKVRVRLNVKEVLSTSGEIIARLHEAWLEAQT